MTMTSVGKQIVQFLLASGSTDINLTFPNGVVRGMSALELVAALTGNAGGNQAPRCYIVMSQDAFVDDDSQFANADWIASLYSATKQITGNYCNISFDVINNTSEDINYKQIGKLIYEWRDDAGGAIIDKFPCDITIPAGTTKTVQFTYDVSQM